MTNLYKNKTSTLLIIFMYVVNALILYNARINRRFANYFVYICMIALLLGTVLIKRFSLEKHLFFYMLSALLFAGISAYINHENYTEWLTLVWFFGVYYCIRQMRLYKNHQILFLLINLLVFWYLILYSYINHAALESYIIGYQKDTSVINPNTVAIGIVESYWLIVYIGKKTFLKRWLSIFLFIVAVSGIVRCGTRSAIIFFCSSLLVYTLLGERIKKNERIAVALIVLIIIVAYVTPYAFVSLWKTYGGGLRIMGKYVFNGRERIWNAYINYLNENPKAILVGTGRQETFLWHGSYNLHNSYLALHSGYGAIATASYLLFIINSIRASYNAQGSISNEQLIMFSMIIMVMMIGIVETTLTYVLSCIYLSFPLGMMRIMRK